MTNFFKTVSDLKILECLVSIEVINSVCHLIDTLSLDVSGLVVRRVCLHLNPRA